MTRPAIPIRWKFTSWYALLLALCLLIFGLIIYVVTRAQLTTDLNEEIGDRSLEVQRRAQTTASGLVVDTTAFPADDDRFIRVWDSSGRLVADTSNAFPELPNLDSRIEAVLGGETKWVQFRSHHESLRSFFAPLIIDGEVVGAMLVAQSTGETSETLARLVRLLLGAIPAVLILAMVSGYVVAGKVLAPVVRITDLVASIDSHALGARLDLPLPDDELGRLARTFDTMLARIEAAFDQQRRFTADAAHELRTPLGIMQSRIDLALARPRSPAENLETLHDLELDLARIKHLATTLLRVARLDSSGFQPELESFDLSMLIGRVTDQYQLPALAAAIEFRQEVVPTQVLADEDLILQLLVNLIDNALRHTPDGGRITLGCEERSDGARLWVMDTGPGIPVQLHDRVFDRFFRVDEGRTRSDGGVGLGLSICHAVVAAHGGSITVSNVIPTGLRVTIRFH